MRSILLVLSFGAVVVLSGCDADRARVEMNAGQRFVPEMLVVEAGEEVAFNNTSDEAHSVTAYEDGIPEETEYFASGGFTTEAEARANVARSLLTPGEGFSVTFTEEGTYRYFCIPHEDQRMVGRIVVEG